MPTVSVGKAHLVFGNGAHEAPFGSSKQFSSLAEPLQKSRNAPTKRNLDRHPKRLGVVFWTAQRSPQTSWIAVLFASWASRSWP